MLQSIYYERSLSPTSSCITLFRISSRFKFRWCCPRPRTLPYLPLNTFPFSFLPSSILLRSWHSGVCIIADHPSDVLICIVCLSTWACAESPSPSPFPFIYCRSSIIGYQPTVFLHISNLITRIRTRSLRIKEGLVARRIALLADILALKTYSPIQSQILHSSRCSSMGVLSHHHNHDIAYCQKPR